MSTCTHGNPQGNCLYCMKRRDRFAAAALIGLLADPNASGAPEVYARDAVQQADALIAELDKPKETGT